MKIAGVSMTYNDGYKLKEWIDHFQIYKYQLYCFVIVDNGSSKEYRQQLRNAFPEAIIIERETNGGCTAAYNDGIKYVLSNTDADSIAIIANDIKPSERCLVSMYEYLFSTQDMGIVSSAILNRNSMIVDNYGHNVKGFIVKNSDIGKRIDAVDPKQKETLLVSGGFNLAKREFYEKTGLQDEKLFMYCDEIDTAYKAKKEGFKLGVIANEYAWHWHISPPEAIGIRHPESRYMISRNRVYLTRKHLGIWQAILCFFYSGILAPVKVYCIGIKKRDKGLRLNAKYGFIGAIYGIRGKMQPNKYSFPLKTESNQSK
ncbi:MAG: glycosyltransferase [Paludibacteraceae bacterium]|nr:glycosyltransferase [Paludibacteraceae bacterium]